MAFVATVTLPEAVARPVADAIADDEVLATAAVDLGEADNGAWQVAVYLDRRPATAELAALRRALARPPGVGRGARFLVRELAETDWVRRSLAALAPVRAGRFLVHGSHDRAKVRASDIAIEIDAGLAFGTGHHGTTAACLAAIDRVARRHTILNALDLGTGTGVLAIAIARMTKARVVASDIDPVAVAIAGDNARLNGVASLVRAVVADGLRNRPVRAGAPYDLIVANILAGPLVALAPAIRRSLAPGGTLILSGILTTQAQRVGAIYRALGLRRSGEITIGEWTTLILRE